MAPLIALAGVFVAALAWRSARGARRRPTFEDCGAYAMAAMLMLTGTSHFATPATLVEMLPQSWPARLALIYATGVIELAAAAGLLLRRTRRLTGWCLVAFFIAVFPANVYAAFQGTGPGAPDPRYLFFRGPLQVLFVAWAWYFAASGRAQREPSG